MHVHTLALPCHSVVTIKVLFPSEASSKFLSSDLLSALSSRHLHGQVMRLCYRIQPLFYSKIISLPNSPNGNMVGFFLTKAYSLVLSFCIHYF